MMRTPWLPQSMTTRPRRVDHIHPPPLQSPVYVYHKSHDETRPTIPVVRYGSTTMTFNQDFHKNPVILWNRYSGEHIKGEGSRKQMNSIKVMSTLISLYVALHVYDNVIYQIFESRRYST